MHTGACASATLAKQQARAAIRAASRMTAARSQLSAGALSRQHMARSVAAAACSTTGRTCQQRPVSTAPMLWQQLTVSTTSKELLSGVSVAAFFSCVCALRLRRYSVPRSQPFQVLDRLFQAWRPCRTVHVLFSGLAGFCFPPQTDCTFSTSYSQVVRVHRTVLPG